jgi:DNA-binding XRE family transcriptional regulator
MTVHVLETDGKPAFVVLPYRGYRALVEAAEDARDARALDAFVQCLEEGREWTVPVEVADRLLAGEPPVRVWRELRGLSAARLAAAVKVTPAHIFKLEAGRGKPSVPLLRRLARVLDVDLELLLPRNQEEETGAPVCVG